MAGFRAHLKSRQRAGDISAQEALGATPVEVKVLDRYLTVASVSDGSGTQESMGMGVPTRLCSMRVILLLEDMGPTGDPDDEVRLSWFLLLPAHLKAIESHPPS